uniref:Transmembrane protein 107 n=1 Tax=Oncorhynchus mykiss TaxID=8022 RepID=A0A8K9X1G5_ONCMY
MSAVSSLVPARFLTLTAHLVIVILVTVIVLIGPQLVVALPVTMGLFAIELAGFFSGVSMFNCTQGLLSTAAHASASVALLFFLFEQWACEIYWWILAFCRFVCVCVYLGNFLFSLHLWRSYSSSQCSD